MTRMSQLHQPAALGILAALLALAAPTHAQPAATKAAPPKPGATSKPAPKRPVASAHPGRAETTAREGISAEAESLLKAVGDLFKAAGGKASPELKKTFATLQAELKFFEGQTAESGLKRANGKSAG